MSVDTQKKRKTFVVSRCRRLRPERLVAAERLRTTAQWDLGLLHAGRRPAHLSSQEQNKEPTVAGFLGKGVLAHQLLRESGLLPVVNRSGQMLVGLRLPVVGNSFPSEAIS